MKEVWKDIIGYESKYQISSLGNVKSLARITIVNGKICKRQNEIILKPHKSKFTGYYGVVLRKEGKHKKQYLIHQLVAKAFLNAPTHCDRVNHKDSNKTNNITSNLEWVTARENSCHSLLLNKNRKSKYTGVSFRAENSKWDARIYFEGRAIRLGSFFTEKAAALTYLKFLIDNNIQNKYITNCA